MFVRKGTEFCRRVRKDDYKDIDAIYAFSSAALEIFEWARANNIVCVLDHATAPRLYEDRLVREECDRFPGWEIPPVEDENVRAYAQRQREEWDLADVILCGSEFVVKAIQMEGGPTEKAVVVPLGLRQSLFPAQARSASRIKSDALRVLFVGDDALRKGLVELRDAIAKLDSERFITRVVGNLSLTDYGRSEACRTLHLVGPIPRSRMTEQYEWADVLVLPSLCDTFALVVLEAMASGLPVITSTNTGASDVVRNGTDGFIVPIRSPSEIAHWLSCLSNDRQLLAQMSANAFERSKDFTEQRYADRLVTVVRETIIESNKGNSNH